MKTCLPLARLIVIGSLVACSLAATPEPAPATAATAATTPATVPAAAPTRKWGDWPAWGDQGDGSYLNPVIPSDYSDIDCIRVGADYYAISSTFQFSPGVVILHSKDLVNWNILGHVISDLNQIGPELNWDKMSRYGKGVWAGAIRFHDNKFWVYFGTPNEGYFMSTAKDPAGPWEPLHSVLKAAGWDDCCPFWDDDGQGYLVGSNFSDGYKIHLFKLTADGRDIVPESDQVIHQSKGSEANKLYKINGLYYHFFSENKSEGRVVMMERAKNIAGPYTEIKQLTHADKAAMEPNQGGLVQTEKGDWYFFTHHGTGAWEGRCDSLLPVTWIDGWPIIGAVGADGIGSMVWSGKIPVANTAIVTPQTDDEFNETSLPPQWEWNYQPRAEKWSLTERPGFLRLHAFKPLKTGDLMTAGNTLTQRVLRTKNNVVTIALDLSGMADGQVAGLCHFAKDNSTLGVRQTGMTLALEFTNNKKITPGPAITSKKIWLRSTWGLDGKSQYSYSVDGTTFTPFGDPYQLTWGNYRGDRIGIYTYNDQGETGYVDVDWFHYTYSSPADKK
jgi:beta-xylosidase